MNRETLLLSGLIAVHLVPLWALPFFPTQDGPAHLAVSSILRGLSEPGGQVLRDYFESNPEPVPNWFVYFVLAKVLRPLPLPLAEKVLLSAYVILLPLSVRSAVRAVEPRNAFLAVLAVPFTFSFLLGMGFYNFCFSLVAFFFALAWWLRHRERFGPLQAVVFAVLLLWVYSCHAVSLVALLVAVGSAAVWRAAFRSELRGLGWLLLAMLPAAALTLSYAGGLGGERTALPLLDNLGRLLTLKSLVSFDSRLRVLSTLLAVCLAGLAAWLSLRRGRPGERDALLAAAAALALLCLVAPDQIGVGGYISDRLGLFPYLVLLPWLATFDHPFGRRLALQLLAAGVALGMLGLLVPRWRELNGYLEEYVAAGERIEPGSTMLHLSFSHAGERSDGRPLADRVLPFLHAGGHVMARKPVAGLDLFAAETDAFPVGFRPERNPYLHLDRETGLTFDFPEGSGGRVDYVVLWWPGARRPSFGRREEVLRLLRSGYDRIHTSPRRLVEIHERRIP